jgi:hypothetical protein
VFSISPYAKEVLSPVIFHTINPLIVLSAFVISNACFYILYRINRSYKLISNTISNKAATNYLKAVPTGDPKMSTLTNSKQPERSKIAA